MFTYIQVIDNNSKKFCGYVDYQFHKNQLSMTITSGFKTAHHINISIDQITDLLIDNFYGYERISFIYQNKKFYIINSGYGEANYFKRHLIHCVNAQ